MSKRIEINCQTGAIREVELTAEEIAAAQAATAQENADRAAKSPDPIDELRAAMKSDPTLLTRLKAAV